MSESCPRCKAAAIDMDPIEGWPVCHACGYLPPEASENLSFEGEYVEHGTMVDEHGQGRAGSSHPVGVFNHGVGRDYSSDENRMRHWHGVEDKVKAMGSQLKLPSLVIEEACLLLDEYRKLGPESELDDSLPLVASASAIDPPIEGPSTRHLSHITVGLIGAGLYAAARKTGNLGLIIQEVAQAAQVQPRVIGRYFKRITRRMGLKFPASSNLRGLVARLAAQIVSRVFERGRDSDQGIRSVHLHPFMQSSRDLAELVVTLHIAESKASHVLASALFELVAEVIKPPSLPSGAPKSESFHEQVLQVTGSNKANMGATKKIMRAELLEFARTLPFGAQIHKHNLISFLPALKELSSTIALIKSKKKSDSYESGSKRARREMGEVEEDARVILGLMTHEELEAERKKDRSILQPASAERRSTWDKLKGAYIFES